MCHFLSPLFFKSEFCFYSVRWPWPFLFENFAVVGRGAGARNAGALLPGIGPPVVLYDKDFEGVTRLQIVKRELSREPSGSGFPTWKWKAEAMGDLNARLHGRPLKTMGNACEGMQTAGWSRDGLTSAD